MSLWIIFTSCVHVILQTFEVIICASGSELFEVINCKDGVITYTDQKWGILSILSTILTEELREYVCVSHETLMVAE